MKCRYCGKEFEPKKRGRKNSGFCSKNCSDSYRRKMMPFKFENTCGICGTVFQTNLKSQKYCSRDCAAEARRTGRTIHKKVCIGCGTEFETVNRKRTFCSAECASKYHGELRKGTYFCEYCGKPRHSDHPNRNRFCSRECVINAHKLQALKSQEESREAREARRLLLNKDCGFCGESFTAKTTRHKYCSSACAVAAQRLNGREEYAQEYVPRVFACAECGKEITTELGNRRRQFCSEVCAKRNEHRKCKEIRRAELNAVFDEQVSIGWVYKKGAGICAICGLPVPDDRTPENPWGVTRDHIVPLSKGGRHNKSNCQLAHRICNSIKLDSEDEAFRIDWERKLREEPGKWNERIDNLMEQLEVEKQVETPPGPRQDFKKILYRTPVAKGM